MVTLRFVYDYVRQTMHRSTQFLSLCPHFYTNCLFVCLFTCFVCLFVCLCVCLADEMILVDDLDSLQTDLQALHTSIQRYIIHI